MIRWFRRKSKTAEVPREEHREPEAELPSTAEEEPEAAEGESAPTAALEMEAAGVQAEPEAALDTAPAQEAVPDRKAEAQVEPAEVLDIAPVAGEEPGESPVEVEEAVFGVDDETGPGAEAASGERRFFSRLRDRLHKTREQFINRMDRLVLGRKKIDMDLLDELEEVLITSDLGVRTTQLLLEKVAEKIKRQELKDPEKLRDQLREEITRILSVESSAWDPRSARPFVIMIIGVNGVAKTTTIGKLAHQFKSEGLKVMLVAADTFRAAAVEQLSLWGERVNVPVVKQKSGSDPSAVAFDAMDAAVSRGMDIVLLDTAGRMHTKVNLMEELKKVQRVVNRKDLSAPHEVLLVLDASTGQNALSQARLFKEEIGVTGLILTKLDGTAKGGIIVAISDELQLPVRYIGIGESLDDLRPFDPEEFTKALF